MDLLDFLNFDLMVVDMGSGHNIGNGKMTCQDARTGIAST